MFLTHSLNYRRQRHLAARQRPLAAKHKNAETKRLPYEILKNKNAIRLRIFSPILYYLLRFDEKTFAHVKQPNAVYTALSLFNLSMLNEKNPVSGFNHTSRIRNTQPS